jgi:H+/Cl- antiporter ClcA
LKFGSIETKNELIPTLVLLPAAIFLGVLGGCLGSLFINVNTRMADIRKKILTKKWMKPIETFMFCFATASAFYWIPYFFN